MKPSGIIYYHDWDYRPRTAAVSPTVAPKRARTGTSKGASAALIGIGLLAFALGGLTGPYVPRIRLEAKYQTLRIQRTIPDYRSLLITYIGNAHAFFTHTSHPKEGPAVAQNTRLAAPAVFDPLKTPDGASIDPVNKDFSLVIPKIGVNAPVIPAVNPTKPDEYGEALKKGIAHSSLSYFPDEDGTVYLFSHSTNYDWFVGDLNAVFYLLKNLEKDDTVILFYKGNSYTYKITDKQVVKPTAVAYMEPQPGARRLILQTCWPPGSTTERLLIFADLVQESNSTI